MQLPRGRQPPTSPPGPPPPPPSLNFWNEWVINETCLFKALLWYTANGISFRSKLLTCRPLPPFPLAFQHPAPPPPPPSKQLFYNAIQLIRKCALMHSVPNSLRDRLWFNRLKDTETWSWNVMLWITYLSSSLSSLYTTLLTSPPPPSPPLLPPLLPSPL